MVWMTEEEREEVFTPSEKEQTLLVLQGKCPHNGGWKWDGHGHNDDCYVCKLCGALKWW